MTARSAAVYVIELYRNMISPLRPASCRFIPTCSQYAVDALTEFGLMRGGWLAMVRLLKCGPWHGGGWDPIPDRESDHGMDRGTTTECGCGVAEHRTNTAQQGKSHTRV